MKKKLIKSLKALKAIYISKTLMNSVSFSIRCLLSTMGTSLIVEMYSLVNFDKIYDITALCTVIYALLLCVILVSEILIRTFKRCGIDVIFALINYWLNKLWLSLNLPEENLLSDNALILLAVLICVYVCYRITLLCISDCDIPPIPPIQTPTTLVLAEEKNENSGRIA